MFENSEDILKVIAKITFGLGIIAGAITLFSLMGMKNDFGSYLSSSENAELLAAALNLIPELACVFSSFVLYGFAMIIENTRLTKEYTYKLLEAKEKE